MSGRPAVCARPTCRHSVGMHAGGCQVVVADGRRCACAGFVGAPPRAAPEKRLQAACRQVAALHGLRAWHLSQARASAQTPGLPDDLYLGGPRPVACEYKAGHHQQTAEQAVFQAAWEAAGGAYWLIRSVDAFVDALAAETAVRPLQAPHGASGAAGG